MGVAGGRGLGTLGRHTTLSANMKGYVNSTSALCSYVVDA
jgi:hypothetical protein